MEPPEPYYTQIILAMVAHVKPHGAVWCSGGPLSYRMESFGQPQYITWEDAAELVGVELPEKHMKTTIKAALERGRSITRRIKRMPPQQSRLITDAKSREWNSAAESTRLAEGSASAWDRRKA